MIHNIVFDFGGVLVSYDFKAYFSRILNSREKGEWFMHHILSPENNNILDKGDRPFKDYMSEWKRQWPDYTVAIDALDKHYTDIFTGEIPGIYDWMVELKAKGYRLLGLSNWSTKVFDVMKKFPRPFSLLDGYLVSHEVHLLKPDVAIYQAFCQRFDVKPDECVFIDDKAENIRGAQKIGMHGIVFKNTEETKKKFVSLLNNNATPGKKFKADLSQPLPTDEFVGLASPNREDDAKAKEQYFKGLFD